MKKEISTMLKEYGFPQENPTVQDFIRACGGKFRGLAETTEGVFMAGTWDKDGLPIVFGGDTAEEAMAILWLNIQKKMNELS